MCALLGRLINHNTAQRSCTPFSNSSRRCTSTIRCAGAATERYHWVRYAHEYDPNRGQHDQGTAASSSSSSSSTVSPSSAAAFIDAAISKQLLDELKATDDFQDLIQLAEQQQCNFRLVHCLKLLFKLFNKLHRTYYELYYNVDQELEEILEELPDVLAQAALALQNHHHPEEQQQREQQQREQQQQQLMSQIADATFAVAVYAQNCEEAAKSDMLAVSSSSSRWYASQGAVDFINAIAALSSSSSFNISNMGKGDTVSLLWAAGQLIGLQQQQQQQQQQKSQAFQQQQQQRNDLVLNLCSHATNLIHMAYDTSGTQQNNNNNPCSVSDPWHPEDLTATVTGLAAAGCKGAAAAALLDAVAHQVYREVSNRHSSAGIFSVEHALKLLEGYADLEYKDGSALRMFDAVAGWIVKRIRSKHVQAISRTEHIARAAQAYSRLQHKSVVVPELLTALGQQAKLAAAAAVEGAAAAAESIYLYDERLPPHYCEWKLQYVAQLLQSHLNLGYKPPEGLLMALMPALLLHVPEKQQQRRQQRQYALEILEVLAITRHHPGSQVVDALLLLVWEDDPQSTLTPHQLVTLLSVTAQLAAAPPAAALAAVADQLTLVAMDCNTYSSSSSGADEDAQLQCRQQRQQRLSASEIIRVLRSLIILGALNIQRLGWLFVAAAAAKWQQLSTRQPLVIKQAQIILGPDGADMAVEVLPGQLVSQADSAWKNWCRDRLVPLYEHTDSNSSSNNQAPASDTSLRQAHESLYAWLNSGSSSSSSSVSPPDWQTVLLSVDVCNSSPMADSDTCQEQQQRLSVASDQVLLLGVYMQQKQRGTKQQAPNTKTFLHHLQPLTMHPLQQQQQQQQQQQNMTSTSPNAFLTQTSTPAATSVILLCHDVWYSSNEPHVPLGDAVLHARIVKALMMMQQKEQDQSNETNEDNCQMFDSWQVYHLSMSRAKELRTTEF